MGKKGKKPMNGSAVSTSPLVRSDDLSNDGITALGIASSPISARSAPELRDKATRVNPFSVSELKHALDDVVRQYLSRPEVFTQSHVHEDVRLVLGWSAAAIAFAAAYHGYRTPFQDSKALVTIGVVLYILLSGAQTIYATYVEGPTVFIGKRKLFDGRVSTERLSVDSHALVSRCPSSHLTALLRKAPPPMPLNDTNLPAYRLTVEYVHSTNNGKSLIRQEVVVFERCFGDFFDKRGKLWKSGFERELDRLLIKLRGE